MTQTASIRLIGPSRIQGVFAPPGDKSISHRAIMFGALSEGKSSWTHFLEAEDCLNTLQAFRAMGVKIDHIPGSGKVEIEGVGMQGLKAPGKEIYLGNSGTSIRLMMGILAGQNFEVTLTGDPSLSSRPMRRVTDPLKQMGAQIKGKDNGNYAPITLHGGKLKGIEYDNKLASAQVKSAILFAGLQAETPTRILEKNLSRDHTERFLTAAGARFRKEGEWLIAEKTHHLKALQGSIPGDMSAAAFFIAGAAMIPGAEIIIQNVCLNPTRAGILPVLKRMGAKIEIEVMQESPELLGNVKVQGTKLKGTRISKQEIPSLIDELPIIMTVMALAEGESLVSGAEELRVKETDRIHSMVTNLSLLGAQIQELPDGCLIKGIEKFKSGQTVQSFADHRTAMSMAIAAMAIDGDLTIDDTSCVATSFPSFFSDFERLKRG